ncbi:hypothetical protein SGQ83_00880 [Flavobacterium sp. Fl-318]|uniref:Uncharacterized protein n=1 Tax=Flavobacterium cupriresistens TaxID=2893885 RepID=A0ABU4R8W6_9FLAO|nr:MULTISPECIES: hypothetical protein [unclassified Flavobacterium]MDX6187890.1 hypothetical protein [Flavobacterium sp. Fl-318]UFH42190.1 hypothetical protein LNP23_20570 [Flavobacterium sp. F-323]
MNCKLTFKERAKIGMEILAKQKPVTLEQARAQAKRLSESSTSKEKKKRI